MKNGDEREAQVSPRSSVDLAQPPHSRKFTTVVSRRHYVKTDT